MTPILPLGAILPYAGEKTDHLESEGWMLCDGRTLSIEAYPDLYASIGGAFGQPSAVEFQIPFLQGLFLRGRHGEGRDSRVGDPDAASRIPLRAGGNSGNRIGSFQQYATAPPRTPFTTSIPSAKFRERSVAGGGEDVASWNNESGIVEATEGGDLETRPKNKYVHFITNYTERTADGRPVQAPVGALMAFPGTDATGLEGNWKLCNGEALSNRGIFKGLFEVLGFAHGKVNDYEFNLPDYRDFFLRGVNGSDGLDPEAERREPPFPEREEGKRGNGGNRVGSVQRAATALPTTRPFITHFPHLPNRYNNASPALGRTVCRWTGSGVVIDLSGGGGDDETRPVNVRVDWYVRFR